MRRVAISLVLLSVACAAEVPPSDAGCGSRDCRPDVGPDAGPDAGCASGLCECTADDVCTSPAPCIDARCELGSCRLFAYDSRCRSGEYCDRRSGCTLLPDGGMMDAPPIDAPPDDAPLVLWDRNLRAVAEPCVFDRQCAPVEGLPPSCIDGLGELAAGVPAPPDGYCSARCDALELLVCGEAAHCVQTDALTMRGWCLRRCATTADCEAGQTCGVSPFGGLGAVRVCLPPL